MYNFLVKGFLGFPVMNGLMLLRIWGLGLSVDMFKLLLVAASTNDNLAQDYLMCKFIQNKIRFFQISMANIWYISFCQKWLEKMDIA